MLDQTGYLKKFIISETLFIQRPYAYFGDILGNNGGGRARMEGAKKRSGNTLRDLHNFSYHMESESSNFLAIS